MRGKMAILILALSACSLAQAKEPLIPKGLVFEHAQAEAATVAQIFLESMAAGRANLLANMGTDPFTIDGRIIKGREEIVKAWESLLKTKAQAISSQGGAKMDTIDYAEAEKRFGKPPKKLAHLNLKKCLFAAVTFKKRPGFLIIMSESKVAGEGWLVTAVTE